MKREKSFSEILQANIDKRNKKRASNIAAMAAAKLQYEIKNAPSAKVIALGRARPVAFADAYGSTSRNMMTDEILGYYRLPGNSLRGDAIVELSRGKFMGRWLYGVSVAVQIDGRWQKSDGVRTDGEPVCRVLSSEAEAMSYIKELSK